MRQEIIYVSRCLLTISFAGIIVIHTNAQNSGMRSNHALIVGTGTQIVNDRILPGSAERLNSVSLAYSFSASNRYRKKSILAGFEKSGGNNGKDKLMASELMLQYSNSFSLLKNNTGRWNNYTGYSIIIDPQYIRSAGQYSWASASSLSFYNSSVYTWKKNELLFDLTVPISGFGSRPEANTTYKGTVNDMLYNSFSRLAFISLHNLKAINISLQYQKAVTGGVCFTAVAAYSYKEMMTGHRLLQQAYRLQAGLSYNFDQARHNK